MANFARKMKRKQMLEMRKHFMKEFKSRMSEYKKQVKCTQCGRPPAPGENIDNWHIDQQSNNIDLICVNCWDSNSGEPGAENET